MTNADRKNTCSCGHPRLVHAHQDIHLEMTDGPHKGVCTVKGCTCERYYGDAEHKAGGPLRGRRRIFSGFSGPDDSTVFVTVSVTKRWTESFAVSEPKLFAEDPIAYIKMGVQAAMGQDFKMSDISVEQIVAQEAVTKHADRKAQCSVCGIRLYGPHAGMMSQTKHRWPATDSDRERQCGDLDDAGEEVVGDLCIDCGPPGDPAWIPLPEPMALSKRTGGRANEDPLDALGKIVRNMGNTNAAVYEGMSMMQLLQIGIMHLECGWDIYPDQWTWSQIRQAMMGHPPSWHSQACG